MGHSVLHVIGLMFGAQCAPCNRVNVWGTVEGKYNMYMNIRLSVMFDTIFHPSFSGV